jgi:hypothetical protein
MRILRRQWVLVVCALAAANSVGLGVFLTSVPQQESVAQVLFLPPRTQAGVEGLINPFLSLGGSLGITAAVVQIRVTDDDAVERLRQKGATGKYIVESNLGQNAGPILIVTATDKSAGVAQATATAVVSEIQAVMQELQRAAGAPRQSYISTTVLTAYPAPIPVYKSTIRLAIVAGALALFGLLILILLLERIRMRRIGDGAGAAQEPIHPDANARLVGPEVESELAAEHRSGQTVRR